MSDVRSSFAASKEYQSFRSSVSQKKVIVDVNGEEIQWRIYDFGPKDVRCPLICLPPVSGTGDVFFFQMMALCCQGYRVIAVEYPVVWTHEAFCESFLALLDSLHLDEVHILGASLGGFLAQKFAEYTHHCQRVQSLILINAFVDTSSFSGMPSPTLLKFMPGFMLKRTVLANYPKGELEANIANSVDFMIERLDVLPRAELSSRLVLNTVEGYVQPQLVAAQNIKVMLIDMLDHCAVNSSVKDEMQKCYPNAKVAQLKDGGNFPYLSRPDEVNMFVQVFLRPFEGTRYSPKDDFTNDTPAADAGPALLPDAASHTPHQDDSVACTLQSEDEDEAL